VAAKSKEKVAEAQRSSSFLVINYFFGGNSSANLKFLHLFSLSVNATQCPPAWSIRFPAIIHA
jgi:hypothetical protein